MVHLLCFQKLALSYTSTFFLTCSSFGTISLLLPIGLFAFFVFIKSPQPRFYKCYPQSKTFVNIQAVPSSAVFCSNAVLITTSSSMHFFCSFDVLPIAPTTTGMTLMLLKFHIFLFLSLVPGISQFFPFPFH